MSKAGYKTRKTVVQKLFDPQNFQKIQSTETVYIESEQNKIEDE